MSKDKLPSVGTAIPPASLYQLLETAYDVTTPHEKDWISDSVVSFMANAGLTDTSTDRFGNDVGDTVQAALLVAALLSPAIAEYMDKLERDEYAVSVQKGKECLPMYDEGWSRNTDEARRETFNAAKRTLIAHRVMAKTANTEHDTNTCEVCADLRREMDANRGAADAEWVCPRTFNKQLHYPHRVPFGPGDKPFECEGYEDPGHTDTYSFNPSNHEDGRTTCGCKCHSQVTLTSCGACGWSKDLDLIEATHARIKSGIDTVNHNAATLEQL